MFCASAHKNKNVWKEFQTLRRTVLMEVVYVKQSEAEMRRIDEHDRKVFE